MTPDEKLVWDFLTNPEWGTYTYMESSEIYADKYYALKAFSRIIAAPSAEQGVILKSFEEGYKRGISDAALTIKHYAKGRPTVKHILLMISQVQSLQPPEPSAKAQQLMEEK